MDPKLQKILEQLEKFGFKFYGYDEGGVPLVKGLNNQIIEINIAINFVNQQVQSQSTSTGGSGSFENAPVNENLDSAVSVENQTERKIELNKETEKSSEADTSGQDELTVQRKAPPIKLVRPPNKPYGDGFDPVSFNPESLNSTLNFIEKHGKTTKTSSNKWLREQFKKFMEEYKNSAKKAS